ncbi:Glucosamine-6-phosphate isomerase [Cladophialophora carrionii]|uniref:Glucosamine-6-phosphate isomerase n=1 Tax=Cladophialophora carrionii TaxID=86049 RepID=A0A1C1CNW3_9EURO|nr:Glucosamine-6-phosphate isomerase [Cladophialophora carrionii]
MRLIVRDTAEGASKYVARYILQRINRACPSKQNPFVLGLPTGTSPLGIYACLIDFFKKGLVSFQHVVTFNMDEYVGIPRDHPQSYHSFMFQHFFDHIDINPENIHILNGNAPDLQAECRAFEEAIVRAGGIDLFLGGMGADGHIAFNEPGSSLASRTRVKTLARDTIRANSRFFGDDESQVPIRALTVGVQTVMDAREVVIIATGIHKSVALQRCIESGVSHIWTLSCLQMHPRAMVVVDEDATMELQVKTVKYFKSVENVDNENTLVATSDVAKTDLSRTTKMTADPSPVVQVDASTDQSSPVTDHRLANGFLLNKSELLLPPPDQPNRTASVSPELIPDRMASRIALTLPSRA